MIPHYDREEAVTPGLKYTEENRRSEPGLPVRDCALWQDGVERPVSDLNLLSFRQRFGAVSVPAEGIGGVETLPEFRRRGYVRMVLERAIAGVAARAPIVFVSDAIEDLYEKLGCVTCLAEGYLTIPLRNLDRLADWTLEAPPGQARSFSPADLPAMISLYNTAHAQRPWTHERHAGWNQLRPTRVWQPGSEVIILERGKQVVGYAILNEPQFGHVADTFSVDELAASDLAAAQALLAEVGARCLGMRFSEFQVREPSDGVVGQAAKRIGCTYHQTYPRSGGMMGAILGRQRLLLLLEPELQRRMLGADMQAAHPAAFDALCRGAIIPDARDLLRLLVGYWSAADARAYGVELPPQHQHVLEAWFPGGGTQQLLLPYAHTLDRY
jgi:hypothetical protein